MYTNSCCNQMTRHGCVYSNSYDGCCDMSNRATCDGIVQTNMGEDECCLDMFPVPSPAKLLVPYKKKKKSSKVKSSGSNRSVIQCTCDPSKTAIETREDGTCNCPAAPPPIPAAASRSSQISTSSSISNSSTRARKSSHILNSRFMNKSRMEVINEESETEVAKEEEEEEPKKTMEQSCTDFLNIVHDNVVETVQKSVDNILRDYFMHTMEKMESLCSQMLRNECMISKMYLDIMDKMAHQNEKNLRQFKCICQFLAETRSPPEPQAKSLIETSFESPSFISNGFSNHSQSSVRDKVQQSKIEVRNSVTSNTNTKEAKEKESKERCRATLASFCKAFSSVKCGPSDPDIPSTSHRSSRASQS